MTAVLLMPVASVRFTPKTAFLGLLLPVAVIAGLSWMHVLAMVPPQGQKVATGHMGILDEDASSASVDHADEEAGEGGVHAGGQCLSWATKHLDVLPATSAPGGAVPLSDELSFSWSEARGTGTDLFSLCVLLR
jgi:hypothetical protein